MRYAVVTACLLLTATALPATPAAAQSVSGPAQAIDGDSLTVSGVDVRLFGIDAPEATQSCQRNSGAWPCGTAAAGKLQSLVEGQTVSCRGRGRDQFGRIVAVCEAGGRELNRTMVAYGWATTFRSYAQDYVADETRARGARRGIWDSAFELPQDFRRQAAEKAAAAAAPARAAAASASPRAASARATGCTIKGNYSRRGEWIFHLPGMPYYAQTRAEAIFCSEAEAQAAGYRRAIVR